MTRRVALFCFVPPALLLTAYVAKSGEMRARREAAELIASARATTDWDAARAAYTSALSIAKANSFSPVETADLRLAVEYARARSGGIVESLRQTERIVADLRADPRTTAGQLHSARTQLATTRYYAAWLMRRDGATRAEWLPLAEAARQDFRYSAEHAAGLPRGQWERAQMDLEATLYFIRRDDDAVRIDPLPEAALASNAGQTRGAIEPTPPKPENPSDGDNRNQMNGSDPNNTKFEETERSIKGS